MYALFVYFGHLVQFRPWAEQEVPPTLPLPPQCTPCSECSVLTVLGALQCDVNKQHHIHTAINYSVHC